MVPQYGGNYRCPNVVYRGDGVISRLWNRLLIRLGIRKPYREPSLGPCRMVRLMEQRLSELEKRTFEGEWKEQFRGR